MAEDKAPEEEAPPQAEKKAGRASRLGQKVDPPVSLYPLTFDEAVDALLGVPGGPSPPRREPAGGAGDSEGEG